MHLVRLSFGLMLGLGAFLFGLILEGGHLAAILYLATALMTVGGTIGYMIMSFPISDHVTSFRAALTEDATEQKTLRIAQQYFVALGNGGLMVSIVSFCMAAIHIMENLDNRALFGPGLALGMATLTYGFLIRTFIARPLTDRIIEKLDLLTHS